MNDILFYLIEQYNLEAPFIKRFKTLVELFKYAEANHLDPKYIKLISSNVYFFTSHPDEHIEIKYKNKIKKKKESGEDK